MRSNGVELKSEMNKDHALIDEFFNKIIGPFATTQIAPLMMEPDNVEERVNLLMECFERFPYLINPFRILIKSIHKTEDEVILEEQIRFYTTKHTRNWLIVNLLNRALHIKEIQLDSNTGRLPAKPHDLIKFAVQAKDAYGEDSRYKDLAFAAGLMFDFLFYLQRSTILDLGQTRFDEVINGCFTAGIEEGKLIMRLSRFKSKLSLEKLTPITPLLRQLSQLSIILLRPQIASEFYKKMASTKMTESVRLALELKTFGVHTGMLSAFFGQSMPIFEQLGEGMSVWGFPFLSWVSGRREIHDLTGMGMLGVALKEHMKGSSFPEGKPVGDSVPELLHLSVTVDAQLKKEIN